MKVVILAAGDATRHKNKPLLPTKRGTVIGDNVHHAISVYCVRPIVVVRQNSAVHMFLKNMYDDEISFVFQPQANGVAQALSYFMGDTVVLFGDCINYDHIALTRNTAHVRPHYDPNYDGWDGTHWVNRSHHNTIRCSFLGAVRMDLDGKSELLDQMNANRVRPKQARVIDCGDEHSYVEYLKSW